MEKEGGGGRGKGEGGRGREKENGGGRRGWAGGRAAEGGQTETGVEWGRDLELGVCGALDWIAAHGCLVALVSLVSLHLNANAAPESLIRIAGGKLMNFNFDSRIGASAVSICVMSRVTDAAVN